ncbi:Na+/H+ antiporter subunit E [Cellulomonas sp.]|uniref:Na+/H+ antiporter subunit E n=1 Tax=Cellulomonas sp. TaxID=40001 RepID=UPI002811390C|nr:Na+/H+ antiporter subunit E [Cellulomonas sp.]
MTRVLLLPLRALAFVLWFTGEIVRSSGAVLADIATPAPRGAPRVVRLPLGAGGDAHLVALSVCITLTPGTLVLGVVPDGDEGRALLVHSLYHPDAETALADLRDTSRRLRAVVRPEGRP